MMMYLSILVAAYLLESPLKLLIMAEESIYNIIPRNPENSPKKPLYRSKYPHYIPPTGSTFAVHTTSKPGVSNLSGQFEVRLEAHSPRGFSQTFGQARGDRRSLPSTFQKKMTGTMGSNQLPPIRNFSYNCSHSKQRVPRSHERPVLGMKSGKNFIVANALDAILSTAKKPKQETNWLSKSNYGKTPEYLTTIKRTLSEEYKMIQTLHQDAQQHKKILSDSEIQELREGLKRKWSEVNQQYQQMTHIRLVDTTGLKRKKLNYEAQLTQIENDIKKLNKGYIFVQE